MNFRFLLFLILPFLAGCLGLSPAARTTHADDIAAKSGLTRTDIPAPPFILAAWSRMSDPTQPIHLYIEGDGAAWVSRHEPALNPTPSDPVALKLAARDPAPNVVYIARPCQFVPLKTLGNDCSVRDWTSDRFSARTLSSYQSALDQIKQKSGSGRFDVIGYSGGGYIAVALAATRDDILTIRTVAGNVDNVAFTTFHHVSPMPSTVSLSPYFSKLSRIPQRHFVGGDDDQVPRNIVDSYRSSLPSQNCVTIDVIPSVDHHEGWTDHWPSLMDRPVMCTQ